MRHDSQSTAPSVLTSVGGPHSAHFLLYFLPDARDAEKHVRPALQRQKGSVHMQQQQRLTYLRDVALPNAGTIDPNSLRQAFQQGILSEHPAEQSTYMLQSVTAAQRRGEDDKKRRKNTSSNHCAFTAC